MPAQIDSKVEEKNRYLRLVQNAHRAYKANKPTPAPTRTELDILKEKHILIRESNQPVEELSWEEAIAEKYYNSLFREFAVVNLKHFKSGKIAIRWRTEGELIRGIGQLTCGSIRCSYHQPTSNQELDPDSMEPLVPTALTTYQVPFGYVEDDEKKSALVKLVLCRECGKKLLYSKQENSRSLDSDRHFGKYEANPKSRRRDSRSLSPIRR